jgi:hypothetical protein
MTAPVKDAIALAENPTNIRSVCCRYSRILHRGSHGGGGSSNHVEHETYPGIQDGRVEGIDTSAQEQNRSRPELTIENIAAGLRCDWLLFMPMQQRINVSSRKSRMTLTHQVSLSK